MSDAPGPPADSRSMLLLAAGRVVSRRLEALLAEDGLTLRVVGTLGHLHRSPGLSYSELARRSQVSVQAMHTTVGKLVERGLVTTVDAGQGTPAALEVSPAGRRALERFHAHVAALDADLDDVALDRSELLVAVQVLGGGPGG